MNSAENSAPGKRHGQNRPVNPERRRKPCLEALASQHNGQEPAQERNGKHDENDPTDS